MIDHIRHESAEPFEEFMIANFNPTFSIDDSYQYGVAMKDDRIQHIFKTAELFCESFDRQAEKNITWQRRSYLLEYTNREYYVGF